jgi:hypothetical protein
MDSAMAKALAAGASQPDAVSSYLLADGTVTAVTDVQLECPWLHPGVLRDGCA